MCPVCRSPFAEQDLAPVESPAYGAKLSATVDLLQTLLADQAARVAIVARWDDLADLLVSALDAAKIPCARVPGSREALLAYETGARRVVVVEHGADGLDARIAANNLVFLSPAQEDPEGARFAEQVEATARRLGHAWPEIHVWRVFARRTIEEYCLSPGTM
jgi:hypothetical protein